MLFTEADLAYFETRKTLSTLEERLIQQLRDMREKIRILESQLIDEVTKCASRDDDWGVE